MLNLSHKIRYLIQQYVCQSHFRAKGRGKDRENLNKRKLQGKNPYFCKVNAPNYMSRFLFNKLYILQSLAEKDQKTGEELERRINDFSKNNNINFQAVLFDLHSIEDWENAWNGIYTSVSQLNIIPIIHLVMHGNESKIGIEQGMKGLIELSELH